MIPDPVFLLRLAQACSAAYDDNQATRKLALDQWRMKETAYYQGAGDARSLVCEADGVVGPIIAFQGTQFSEGQLPSIFANLDDERLDLGGGRHVHAGYFSQFTSLYKVMPHDHGPVTVTGHSMGGCIAELWGSQSWAWQLSNVFSFAAPKCANAGYWKASQRTPTRIIHARDVFTNWPFFDTEWVQPGGCLWLTRKRMVELTTGVRPVFADSVADHSIDGYISALLALAGGPP